MSRHKRKPTLRTKAAVELILEKHFSNKSVRLVEKTGLDEGAVSRLLADENPRPATPEMVGIILRAVPAADGIALLTAFLTDVATEVCPGYKVAVTKEQT